MPPLLSIFLQIFRAPIGGIRRELAGMPWTSFSLFSAWACWWLVVLASVYWLVPKVQATEDAQALAAREAQALRADLQVLAVDLRRSTIWQIDRDVIETKRLICQAEGSEQRAFMRTRLEQLTRDFRAITGESYSIPECSEI